MRVTSSDRNGPREGRGRAAVLSTDREFRARLRAFLEEAEAPLSVELELGVPFTDVTDTHLERLRALDPDVVFLDLHADASVGLKFAQFLADSLPGCALVASGSTDNPELLLAAMQAGISEYLGTPLRVEEVRSAVERILRKTGRREEGAAGRTGRVLPVFGAKGGSGSTTVSTNLAVEIHRLTRKRTLLLDLDLELGETALLLGMDPRFSIVDLVRNFHRVDSDLLASYIERHETGVELLSAPYQPADFEAVSGDRVRQIIDFLKRHYDYIVIDAPKTFNPASMAAFEDADELYLVTTADLPSIRNLSRSLPLVKSLGRGKEKEWLRLVVNRHESRGIISLDEVEETLGLEVYWTLPNDYGAVMASINAGQPVVMDAQSAFARSIRGLAGKVTGVPVAEEKGGLLATLMRPFRDGKVIPSREPTERTTS